jgi:hypothetical protein
VIGREAVRDAPATRYRASLELQEALARAPRSARWRVESAFLSQLSGFSAFRSDIWLDDDGRVRRMVSHHALGPEEGRTGRVYPLVELETDYELYDLGGSFEIPLPPRRIVRVSKLMAIAGALDRTWAVARSMRRAT